MPVPAEILRAVVAVELSLMTATAIEIPTPVLPDFVSPAVFVLTALVSVEDASSAPPMVSTEPVPSSAELSSLAIDTATTGVMPVSPAPPAVALVSIVWLPIAVSVRLFAPVSAAPSSIVALFASWP